MDLWLAISSSFPFAIWVARDSSKRLMKPATWALSALFVLPIALPIYAARRHLFAGETRKGGVAWNGLRYFAILWTVAMALIAYDVLSGQPAIAEQDVWTQAGAFTALGVLGALWFGFAISRRGRVLLNVLIGTLLVLSAASTSPLDPGEQIATLSLAFVLWLLPVALALAAGLIFRRSGTVERGPTGPLAVGPVPTSSAAEAHVVSSPHAVPLENEHQRQETRETAVGGAPTKPVTADLSASPRAFESDRPEDEDRHQEGAHGHPTPRGDRAGSAEAEHERQATAGRPPLPRSSRFTVTRFRALLLAMLSVAVASAFLWATQWQYRDLRGPRGMVRAIRVNRWTGSMQVFACGLTREGAREVRALRVQLANTMLLDQGGDGLRGLSGLPYETYRTYETAILPCPTCPVDGEKAQEIAQRFRSERQSPWGTDPRVLELLERLDTARATHWQCAYR